MRTFLINFVLALVGTNLVYRFFPELPATGFVTFGVFFGVVVLLWLLSVVYDRGYFRKFPKVVNLFVFFLKELFMANLKVTWDVITPNYYMQPGVIAYPLEAKTDMEITILANLISLTPGTLSLEVSEDRKVLYFHAMYISGGDIEAAIRDIREGFEKKLLAITR